MVKQILLADDSITIQKVVELTFSDTEYKVTSVSGGGQALAKVREARPDLILCDVIMPEKNGYEVTEALKSSPATKAIPIILLSGTFEPFDEERARKAGADDWITKPFESQQLISKVEELLKKRIMVSDIEQSVPGAINTAPGSQGKAPNPGLAVEFSSPMGMAAPPPPPAAEPPPAKHISAAITLPPPPAAPEPPPSPFPAPVAALGAPLPPAEPSSLHERRQMVTQEMSRGESSVTPSYTLPAPSAPATAPWAPLPPAALPAETDANATLQYNPPAPARPEEPEAEIGAGTVQLMVDSVKPPWESAPPPPPPAEARPAFSPSEIRPSQLLEDTHRKGAPAMVASEPLKPWEPETPAPPVAVSYTEKTESLPVPSFLQAEPETPAPWLAPASEPAPGESIPPFMAPALNAESAPPPWLAPASDPVPSAPEPMPSFMASEPAAEPAPAAPVPSWLAPAYEPPPLPVEPSPAAEPEAAFAAPVETPAPAWLSPEPEPLPAAEPAFQAEPAFAAMPEPLHRVGADIIPGGDVVPPMRPVSTQPFPKIQTDAHAEESDGIQERRQAVTREMTGKRQDAPALIEAAVVSPASAPWTPLPSMSVEPEPAPEVRMTTPPVVAPEPEPAASSAPAEPALAHAAAAPTLSEAQVEAIARKIVELFGDRILKEVAWEVIPDLAEMVIKTRIAELEAEAHQEAPSGSKAES